MTKRLTLQAGLAYFILQISYAVATSQNLINTYTHAQPIPSYYT
jgi:hypothetical protein